MVKGTIQQKNKILKCRRSLFLFFCGMASAVLLYGCAAAVIESKGLDCVDKAIAEMIIYKRHYPDAEIYAAVAKTQSRLGSENHVEPVVKKAGKYYFFGFDGFLQKIEEKDMQGVFADEPTLYPMDVFIKAAQKHSPLTLLQLQIYNAVLASAKS
jgi:hypothetical protein